MYSVELQKLVERIDDKKYMISLSLQKDLKQQIVDATSWMDKFYHKLPLKIRALAIKLNYTEETIPKCPQCGMPVAYEKSMLKTFNKFCSDKCSKTFGRLSPETKEKLNDREWLFQKRIVERMNYGIIGELIGCSEGPVKHACKQLDIPKIDLKESIAVVKSKLLDKEWLIEEHRVKRRKLKDIAVEIGSSVSTLSRFLHDLNVETNAPNSYDRPCKASKEALEVGDFIRSLGCNPSLNNRSTLNGREIDILLKDEKIGFEYNGIYHHVHQYPNGVINKSKDYHLKKTVDAASRGIKLFHIFSDDWLYRKDIVKSIIAAKLGKSPITIYARKCEIVELKSRDKMIFLNENHLQGADKSTYGYGLRYDGSLVAVMTFCNSRYNKHFQWELSRFAVKINTSVVGGFSRLLKHFRSKFAGSIISYADRSISDGGVYQKNGFELIRINPPNYKYVKLSNSIQRLNRYGFMKSKIAEENDPRSEREIMLDNGYSIIYDCGTLAYGIQ